MPFNYNEFSLPPLTLGTILWTVYFIYMVGAAIFIISENRSPSVTMAWILSFLALPVIGVLFYIFLGRTVNFFSRRLHLIPQEVDSDLLQRLRPMVARQATLVNRIRSDPNRSLAQRRLAEMIRRTGLSVLTAADQVEILQDASVKYPLLEADIEAAQYSVHMEYFIWEADSYMQRFADLLIRKAQQGVEVRILFDALGSHFLLWKNRGYLNRLRRGGVKIYPYLNFLGLLQLHTVNYRNHRKIAVIDGKIGYTGGMNMGEEHLIGAKPYTAWRDTHLRLTGDTVSILQGIFITSWFNTTKEVLADLRYFPEHEEYSDNPIAVQIVLSGPDSQWHAIQQQYFLMIMSAQQHVYIQSPFFIPNSSIYEALRVVALSGVDVKLMFAPRDTGSPIANWAANTYFVDMIEAGAKVYLYQPAYMHAKTISIDAAVCSVGTANMDIRSFNINYEMNAVIYDATKAKELEAAFEHDLEGCVRFDAKAYLTRSRFVRFRDSLARLLSPLL
jgi:cardiolipin synthase A/B